MRWVLMLLLAGPVWAGGDGWLTSMKEARAAAQKSGRPIFIDFQAVWCYSCYYMEEHVLSKKRFRKASKDIVLLKLDVDRSEGRDLRKKYSAWFLPSYVFVTAEGEEIGRIIGEQTEKDFLKRLETLKHRRPSGALAQLTRLYESGEFEAAAKLRKEEAAKDPGLAEDDRWLLLSARLDIRRAYKKKDVDAAASAVERVLALPEDCSTPYDLSRFRSLAKDLSAERRKNIFARAAERLENLSERRVFGRTSERCADLRSVVSTLAGLYAELGQTGDREKLLRRVIGLLENDAGGRIGRKRNRDDNLRFFLEAAENYSALDALYPRLVDAYPADYVYAYRFAKNLLSRNKAGEALRWVKKAGLLSYGANRLTVTGVHADVLKSLGRRSEARRILERDIRAQRRRFPEGVKRLEGQLAELAG